MDTRRHGEGSNLTRRLTLIAAYGFSLAATFLLLQPGATTSESTPFGDFRGYFPFDQLTYAAIASNAASGNFALVEPFTETGTSFYPSLWYLFLGLIAGVTGLGIPAAWTLLGALAVGAAVTVVGLVAHRVSGRPWAPALVGPALWIGPIALAVGDRWFIPLESHALLWGPYGELFSLNAEAVGIGMGAIALVLLVLVSQRNPRSSSSLVVVGFAALIIGLLANIHTYSFLVTIAYIAAWMAIVGIGTAPAAMRSRMTALSVAIVVAVGLVGALIAPLRESLVMFGLMLLAALPGGVNIARRVPRLAFVGFVAVAIASAPQILHVIRGITANDPFLVYRQAQSGNLGIDPFPFVVATLPVALWAIAITLAARRARLPLPLMSSMAAGLVALTLLSFNDVWGFVQEPYRMWIASLTLTALVGVPLTARVLSLGSVAWPEGRLRVVAVAAVVLIALSWWNVGGFRAFVQDLEPIPFGSSRLTALGQLTQGRGGLIASDPCVDPLHLKIVSRERVAFYSEGLAWPAEREPIDRVLDARRQEILDPAALRAAGVTYLVTDSYCPSGWESLTGNDFAAAGEVTYGPPDAPGTLRMWLLQ